MDPFESREVMGRQAAALVVVMVSFVTSRLKRRRGECEPNPLLLTLRDEAEKHRQRTLNLIYNSTDVECLSMLRMTRAPFFLLCATFLDTGALYLKQKVVQLRSRLQCSFILLVTTKGLGLYTSPLGGP
jgi:hypothetical protein